MCSIENFHSKNLNFRGKKKPPRYTSRSPDLNSATQLSPRRRLENYARAIFEMKSTPSRERNSSSALVNIMPGDFSLYNCARSAAARKKGGGEGPVGVGYHRVRMRELPRYIRRAPRRIDSLLYCPGRCRSGQN